MNKIIITGAGGFVGARIAHHLKDRAQLISFPKGMLARADMQEIRTFLLQNEPQAIIHTAAIADMGKSDTTSAITSMIAVSLVFLITSLFSFYLSFHS